MGAEAKNLARAWSLLKEQAFSGQATRSALIELASRMAGFEDWHRAGRARPSARGALRAILSRSGPALGRGLRVDWARLDGQATSKALLALTRSSPRPAGWSEQAWRGRLEGLAALLPETMEAMKALGQPCSIGEVADWEGISRARSFGQVLA